jgi:phosphatidylinositol-4,5-bisphosphate 3-kinase
VRREVRKDAITEIDPALKPAVWQNRLHFKTQPRALTKVLQCADWSEPSVVAEVHRLLKIWEPLSPYESLELFDAAFSDPGVRAYAVQRLGTLENPVDFSDLLLQLVQVIKHEPYHDSPLVRLLLKRALEHKDIVGYALFWGLKAEAYLPEIQQRFLLLVEAYLRGCGRVYRTVLVDQVHIMDTLTRIALGLVEVIFEN